MECAQSEIRRPKRIIWYALSDDHSQWSLIYETIKIGTVVGSSATCILNGMRSQGRSGLLFFSKCLPLLLFFRCLFHITDFIKKVKHCLMKRFRPPPIHSSFVWSNLNFRISVVITVLLFGENSLEHIVHNSFLWQILSSIHTFLERFFFSFGTI